MNNFFNDFDTLKFVGSLFSKTMPYFSSTTQWQFKKYSNFIDAIHFTDEINYYTPS